MIKDIPGWTKLATDGTYMQWSRRNMRTRLTFITLTKEKRLLKEDKKRIRYIVRFPNYLEKEYKLKSKAIKAAENYMLKHPKI